MENSRDYYLKSGKNKEVYIDAADKSELMIIVAETGAKSLRAFLYDLFFNLATSVRDAISNGEEVTAYAIDKDFVREGSVNVNYIYNPDVEYFLRIGAAKCDSRLTSYLRSAIHLLCEQHRNRQPLWIDTDHNGSVQIRMRKEYLHHLARDL